MKLESVVPFGRSLDEYIHIFNLSDADLNKRILGVGDGPASFNAEATTLGVKVCSIDPIYEFTGSEILQRFEAVVDNIIDQMRASPNDWVWSYHTSLDGLRQARVQAIQTFLEDYDSGKRTGRYQIGALPQLDFGDRQFELALCSHFLFLYSDHYDEAFHAASIHEMLRVSQEVRIFPLLTLGLQRSPYLESIVQAFSASGYAVSVQTVAYELQKGGNEMLVIKHR